MTTPATPAQPVAPTGPVARDPLLGTEIPVYVGGEGPVPTPPAGDRGDSIAPAVSPSPVPPAEPAKPAEESAAAVPNGNESTAPAAAVDPAAEVTPSGEPSDEVTQPAATEPTRNDKGQFIPRSRFNQVNERAKALQIENEQLKAEKGATAQASEGTYDFDTKEKEYANLVLDGKVDEAIALRKEIRTAERAEFQKDAAKTVVETTERTTVKQRIDQISERYATALPQFDPESEHYNDELLADVAGIYRGALESGRYADAPAAFQASLDKALKLHNLSLPAEPTAPAAAAVAPTATPPAPAAPARTAEKRVQAIVSQPPSLSKVGTTGAPETHATIDVAALSEADLRKLPPATLARLRGDFI